MDEEKCVICDKCNDIETENDYVTDGNGLVLCPICFDDAQYKPTVQRTGRCGSFIVGNKSAVAPSSR